MTLSPEELTVSPAIIPALASAYLVAPPGDHYEFGVFRGGSLLAATRYAPESTRFFGFDTFDGMPELTGVDTNSEFQRGQFHCTREDVERNLGEALARTTLVQGDFTKLKPEAMPSGRAVAVAVIDSDLYASAAAALKLLEPRLQPGSVLLFDDWNCFGASNARGERRAFAEFQEASGWRGYFLCDFGWHGRGLIVTR